MKNIKISTLSIIISILSYSCTDLSEEVFSEITEASYNYQPSDATRIIGASYSTLRGYFTMTKYWGESISSDEAVMPANASGWDDNGIYRRMHTHSWTSEQKHFTELWDFCYYGIALANRGIEQLSDENFPMASNENRKQLVAELKTLRAFHYWRIIDAFGDAPLVTQTTLVPPVVSKRKDIYEFVVNELNECMDDLSEEKNSSNYGRFNKWGAKCILANLYLNSEVYIGNSNWDLCISQCDDIINSNKYSLDASYRDPFKRENQTSLENIFVVPYDEVFAGGFDMWHATLHSSNKITFNTQDAGWGAGSYKAVPQFINTYDPDDERLKMTWLSGLQLSSDGSDTCRRAYTNIGKPLIYVNSMPDGIFTDEADGYRWIKYDVTNGQYNLSNDGVIFRYAQVLMMKAECLLRKGEADAAADIVTEVRRRAFKSVPSKAIVSGSDLLKPSTYIYGTVSGSILKPQGIILPEKYGRFYDELGYEFAGEGSRRRDMIRFGHFTKAQWLSHTPNGDFRTVFPIPQPAINANPKLEQNSNYK